VPLFRGSSRFESLILSHRSGFSVTCECNEEEINDDDDARSHAPGSPAFLLVSAQRSSEEIKSGNDSPERKIIGSSKEWVTPEEATRLRAPSVDRFVAYRFYIVYRQVP